MMAPTQFIDIGMAWIFTFFGTSASASASASVFASGSAAAGANSWPPCFEPSCGAQPQDRVAGHSKAHSTGPLGSIGQPLTGSFSAVRPPASIGSAGLLSIQPMLYLSALVTCEWTMGHAQGLG